MATLTKTASKIPTKTPTKALAKAATPVRERAAAKPGTPVADKAPRAAKARATAPSQPSLRFHHSQALRDKTDAVLSAVQAQPNQGQHGEAVADLVAELVDAGMDYYFMKALKQADMGFVAEQSARLGMSGAVKLLSSVTRKFITRMDQAQLLVVATHIRALAASA